jgi:transposase-like protein
VIDETSLHLERCDGELEEGFLWAAIDPDTLQLVPVTITDGRGGVEALGFINGALARCDNQPVVHVDRGGVVSLAVGPV